MNILSDLLIGMVGIVIAISIHEYGHALAAYMLGDNTAKMYGRLTVDPIKHIDPVGLLMLVIFRFGWAKPVPINPNNFKNYKIGSLIVSLAGSVFNILTAIVFMLIYKHTSIGSVYAMRIIVTSIISYNIAFAAFNLLPIPPLDGWGVVSAFLPVRFNEFAYKYESMGSMILILLLITKTYWIILSPIYNVIQNIVFIFA